MTEILSDPKFMAAAGNTVLIGLMVAFINLALGICIGGRLAKGANVVVDAVITAPLIVPLFLVMSAVHVGMIRAGITDSVIAVVLIHLPPSLPYSIKICRNGYAGLGANYHEHAAIMGAGRARAFFEVSVPMLKSAYQYAFMLAFAVSAGQYATTAIIGGGKVVTLSMLYFPFFNSVDGAYMWAFSAVFALIPLIVFFMFKALYEIVQFVIGRL